MPAVIMFPTKNKGPAIILPSYYKPRAWLARRAARDKRKVKRNPAFFVHAGSSR